MKVRTRFAPSPTGFMHVGSVRTVLFNYLYAKKHGGQVILRLEDTDQERFVAEGVEQIVNSLEWLGLKPDEGFWLIEEMGEFGPYVQSKRLPKYQECVQKLLAAGLAYRSYSTPGRLEELRLQAATDKKPFLYRKKLEPASKEGGRETPIRLDIEAFFETLKSNSEYFHQQDGKWQVKWHEPTGRAMEWESELIDDFILVKADGFPTYNFANVVDDYEMQITHVLRGDEFLSSTPKHLILYQALGFENVPEFAHLPAINGTDGKKLSKRTGDTDVLEYKASGYLSESLLNFLALLGWNDGSEQEIFSMQELIQAFSLEHVNLSPAVFDPKRLDWMNGLYIRELPIEQLLQESTNFWPSEAKSFDEEYKKRTLEICKDRLNKLSELPKLSSYFFSPAKLSPKHLGQINQLFESEKIKANDWLEQAIEIITRVGDGERGQLEQALREAIKQAGQPKALFGILRIGLTGADQTPPIWDIVFVLGKDESIDRLESLRSKL